MARAPDGHLAIARPARSRDDRQGCAQWTAAELTNRGVNDAAKRGQVGGTRRTRRRRAKPWPTGPAEERHARGLRCRPPERASRAEPLRVPVGQGDASTLVHSNGDRGPFWGRRPHENATTLRVDGMNTSASGAPVGISVIHAETCLWAQQCRHPEAASPLSPPNEQGRFEQRNALDHPFVHVLIAPTAGNPR